ncbi:ADP-ribosylglycohydrolase family protein [Tropicimonas isoalkanivorans]|uniref:ADP-ribosylglycohydrolase n=1 Tax=Tropicimonas isoalkanivorans TaxID=441112 RepID=A0A1I1LVQ2_9RHOB|nr:ADP-ribosylglycohydrolase family protein [Tropicimonas isoalkanivorans]SFC73560.1 ADP-ribosylglycohydrolase [Tropicimonas isoalkanivorans]
MTKSLEGDLAPGAPHAVDRARGALQGLALGDALGMPSQTLTRQEILDRYGVIVDFVAPFDDHPVSHGLAAAQVTDDTEQALLLANRLIASPERFDADAWARDLLAWEADVRERGLRDLLGPSTKAALTSLLAGTPASETGRKGTTNGAAMRIAPVGIATPCDELSALVARVAETCQVTHNTGEAIAGAAAVAAMVSAGVDGSDWRGAIPQAMQAARLGQAEGAREGVRDMADRIEAALKIGAGDPGTIADRIGTSVASYESVPAAFAVVAAADGDAWRAGCLAANLGDDTDTIGAIAGAICGACSGAAAMPADKVARLRAANTLGLDGSAEGLLALRTRSAQHGSAE